MANEVEHSRCSGIRNSELSHKCSYLRVDKSGSYPRPCTQNRDLSHWSPVRRRNACGNASKTFTYQRRANMSETTQYDGPRRLIEFSPAVHTPTGTSLSGILQNSFPKCRTCGQSVKPSVDAHWIVRLASRAFFMPEHQITGKARTREVVHVRSTIAVVMRARKYTLVQIGRVLGGRDHSTVINLLRSAEQRRERLEDDVVELERLTGEFAEKNPTPGPGNGSWDIPDDRANPRTPSGADNGY